MRTKARKFYIILDCKGRIYDREPTNSKKEAAEWVHYLNLCDVSLAKQIPFSFIETLEVVRRRKK